MGEIRIVGPGKTRGFPNPVCKKKLYFRSEDSKSYNHSHNKPCTKRVLRNSIPTALSNMFSLM